MRCSCAARCSTLRNAVGRINYVENGGNYNCSGQLLQTQTGDLTPYFLTAEHCISTVEEAQAKLAAEFKLPERYHLEWAGQYDQLKNEQRRLSVVVPLALIVIWFLLYTAFDSLANATLVLLAVPFALIGGVLTLVATGTHFSISAAVGVISTLGVAILGGVLLISRIEDLRKLGHSLEEAVRIGADNQLRPILMATLGAAIGLFPAAIATGIGSQAQKPLARVVVGGMLSAAVLILIVLPVLYQIVHQRIERRRRERFTSE